MADGIRPDARQGVPGAATKELDTMADLKNMKGVSEADRKLLEEAEELLGAEPESMGFAKDVYKRQSSPCGFSLASWRYSAIRSSA